MKCGEYKLDLGCGRIAKGIGIDIRQIKDAKGNNCVDIVRDIEKHGLPFCDNSAIEIKADNFLEHIQDLSFVLNECWRVLKPEGFLHGIVPLAGTDGSYRDPTHKRFFTKSTFDYFCGSADWKKGLPQHPKYTQYDFLLWKKIEVSRPKNNGHIYFKLMKNEDI